MSLKLLIGAFAVLVSAARAQLTAALIPNTFIVQIGSDCTATCLSALASTSGAGCTARSLGGDSSGQLSWAEVKCSSGANSLSSSTFKTKAQTTGVSVQKVEQSKKYFKNQLWNIDEVDASKSNDVIDGERCTSSNLGKKVLIVVMDTGCKPKGVGFDAIKCKNFVSDGNGADYCTDGDLHGTHVAGIAASGIYGVVPLASLSCIRVLDDNGSGSDAGIIEAINFVAEWSRANTRQKIIINMSLGGSKSKTLNAAIVAATRQTNIFFTLAAGNENSDAKKYSPSSASNRRRIFAVGSHTQSGARSNFSNYGRKVQLSAPGSSILSTVPGGTALLSGTSMAAPHVAGAMAVVWSSNKRPTLQLLTEGGTITYPDGSKPKLSYYCNRM